MIRRLLLAIAFGPAAFGLGRLARFPGYAAANGAGDGSRWPAATIAVVVAGLVILCAVVLAWRVADHAPRLVAVLPLLCTLVVVSLRRLAASGAPEEIYLVDDAKLWLALLAASVVFAIIVALAPVPRITMPDDGATSHADGIT